MKYIILILYFVFSAVLGKEQQWMCLTGRKNVFGLTRTQTNVDKELDGSRRLKDTAYILVGFE